MTRKEFYLRAVIETYSALLRNSDVAIPDVKVEDIKGNANVFTDSDALDRIDHLRSHAINLAACLTEEVEEDSWKYNVVGANESPFE